MRRAVFFCQTVEARIVAKYGEFEHGRFRKNVALCGTVSHRVVHARIDFSAGETKRGGASEISRILAPFSS